MRGKRLYLIDLLRSVSIWPIVSFHVFESIYFSNEVADSVTANFASLILARYSQYFAFSGFTIVFIFFFLVGYKSVHVAFKKVLIAVSGLLVLSLVNGFAWYDQFVFDWDIYHFLLFAFLALYVLQRMIKGKLSHIILFLFLTCVPYWKLEGYSSSLGYLVGFCETGTSGLWYVLPNIFLVLLSYSLGKFVRDKKISPSLQIPMLFSSLCLFVYVGHTYFRYTYAGDGFGCYIHRPPVLIWCSLILALVLFFLSSSHSDIQKSLDCRAMRSISKFEWNQNFGLCYLVQWVLIASLSLFSSKFIGSPMLAIFAIFVVLLLTEMIVRNLKRIF